VTLNGELESIRVREFGLIRILHCVLDSRAMRKSESLSGKLGDVVD
jgi:hypothetical protein